MHKGKRVNSTAFTTLFVIAFCTRAQHQQQLQHKLAHTDEERIIKSANNRKNTLVTSSGSVHNSANPDASRLDTHLALADGGR